MIAHPRTEWFDNDVFWIELYHYLFPERRFVEALEQAHKIVNLAHPPGNDVLDLCCGPGRHAIALAQQGFKVTGVDRTPFLLKKAREKAKAARVKIEWIRNDMRTFVRPGSYDLVMSMFTSFGYFDNKHDDLAVLRNIFTNLRPGGACLIDVLGKELLARIFQRTSSEALSDGRTLVQHHEIFDEWTRVRNEWILIHKGRTKAFKFHHTIYSGQELRDRLELVGFHDVKLYGNLNGEEYGPQAERLIVVGRKPGRTQIKIPTRAKAITRSS